MKALGVTGGRDLAEISDERQKRFIRVLRVTFGERDFDQLHHGGCTGVDKLAHDTAIEMGVRVVVHPPDNRRHECEYADAQEVRPRLPYLERNRRIVEAVDGLLALPSSPTEVVRSGSWATVRYARARRVPVKVV